MEAKGFKYAGIAAGIKKNGKKDLALICSDSELVAAGVFTTCAVKAAPVVLDRERLKDGKARAIIINSGNANACTGEEGYENALATAKALAEKLDIAEEEVLVSSTGVIGEQLPMDKMLGRLGPLVEALDEDALSDAAEAIMTTDLFSKTCSRSVRIEGKEVTVTGLAKGAGMISPDMATMLAYVMTDANIDADTLQHALEVATNVSFNCITVDGDMSTNDTVIALASGKSGVDVKVGTAAFEPLLSTMKEVMIELARMIVRDGEGATKLIEIRVTGAETAEEAKKAACKVANSPLVKTAFYGEDANWGRIAAAVGGAGIILDESRLGIAFDDIPLVENGLFIGKEAEAMATKCMKAKEITLTIAINLGACDATVWTCDLTHDYIRINAEYRS